MTILSEWRTGNGMTTGNFSGSLVRRFLEQAYEILSESESFFTHVKIHVVQCDNEVQSDRLITDRGDLQRCMASLEIAGEAEPISARCSSVCGGLTAKKELGKIRGLIYFTDVCGRFPVKTPPYDTAFVFMKDDYSDAGVPPRAMKVILDLEDLQETDEEREADTGGREY